MPAHPARAAASRQRSSHPRGPSRQPRRVMAPHRRGGEWRRCPGRRRRDRSRSGPPGPRPCPRRPASRPRACAGPTSGAACGRRTEAAVAGGSRILRPGYRRTETAWRRRNRVQELRQVLWQTRRPPPRDGSSATRRATLRVSAPPPQGPGRAYTKSKRLLHCRSPRTNRPPGPRVRNNAAATALFVALSPSARGPLTRSRAQPVTVSRRPRQSPQPNSR